MTALPGTLRTILSDLAVLQRNSAVVGGLAVAIHAEPRFTRDIDLAVAVRDDADAEELVRQLQGMGYQVLAVIEQTTTGRMAATRLAPPGASAAGIVIDLLFASSGIEQEIVKAAGRLRVFEDVEAFVIRRGHLIALKILARDDLHRPMDRADLVALVQGSSPADLDDAREALRLIAQRGFSRGKDLIRDLEELILNLT